MALSASGWEDRGLRRHSVTCLGHAGIKFAAGTYRVKNGVKIVWNGKEWVDESSGRATDPL